LQDHKDEVTTFLREEFGTDPIIKYAGSREKGTMISENYDLDVICYFPSSDTRTLKEIRDDVSVHLNKKYLMQDKASAERILNLKGSETPHDYHIDVVPGRFIEGSKDVFLHLAFGEKERLQTNLKTHIDFITNSGCVDVIRLVKLWSCRNGFGIKTFVLELFVIHSLTGSKSKSELKKSFVTVLQAFRDEFETVKLIDPANTNNIVSQLVKLSDKTDIANAANKDLQLIEDSSNVEEWKSIFHETDDDTNDEHVGPAIRTSTESKSFTPHSPWCSDYADN